MAGVLEDQFSDSGDRTFASPLEIQRDDFITTLSQPFRRNAQALLRAGLPEAASGSCDAASLAVAA